MFCNCICMFFIIFQIKYFVKCYRYYKYVNLVSTVLLACNAHSEKHLHNYILTEYYCNPLMVKYYKPNVYVHVKPILIGDYFNNANHMRFKNYKINNHVKWPPNISPMIPLSTRTPISFPLPALNLMPNSVHKLLSGSIPVSTLISITTPTASCQELTSVKNAMPISTPVQVSTQIPISYPIPVKLQKHISTLVPMSSPIPVNTQKPHPTSISSTPVPVTLKLVSTPISVTILIPVSSQIRELIPIPEAIPMPLRIPIKVFTPLPINTKIPKMMPVFTQISRSKEIPEYTRSHIFKLGIERNVIFSVDNIPVRSEASSFLQSVEKFERRFYKTSFTKLSSMSSNDRQENGVSFLQSGLFLFVALVALSSEVDESIKQEIVEATEHRVADKDHTALLREITSFLPVSSGELDFRRVIRLVLRNDIHLSDTFINVTVSTLDIRVGRIPNNTDKENLTSILNDMVTDDSGGALKSTFEEYELSDGICGVLVTTMYLRPRWRSPPTVMNGTYPFHDLNDSTRSTRMIRINDVMMYADLPDWDAQAIEIQYSTPDLSLLLLVPRNNSLRRVASNMWFTSTNKITNMMRPMRLAITLPLYTLRMTLLLPNKLEEMGIKKLFIDNNTIPSKCESLRLSHAVQRLMFWSEAGRNAFKDDGVEWEETAEKEILIDHPYLFYVRWKNVTVLNGNFVL